MTGAGRDDVLVVVGGLVDESRVTLGIHGPDLDPAEVSSFVGCAPTSAHRRGDPQGRGSSAWQEGCWLLRVAGKAPMGPEDLVQELLRQVPLDPARWERLRERHTVRVTFGIFTGAWNRGFELSHTSISGLSAIGAVVGFDIYSDGDEHDGG